MSTLIGCVDGIITSTARVFIDSSQPTAGTATFTVLLDVQPAGDVIVAVTSTDGNVATVSPVPLVFTPSNYTTPHAVTVTQLTPQFVSAQTSVTLRRHGCANKTVDVRIDDGSQSGDGRAGEINRWLGRKF